MFFLLFVAGTIAWKYVYDFDITWKGKPDNFHAHYPSVKDINHDNTSVYEIDRYISERTLLVSQYYLLRSQLEDKYSSHKQGSIPNFVFFVLLPLLLSAKSATFFSSPLLNWASVLVVAAVCMALISIIARKFFRISPFEFDYTSNLQRIKDEQLEHGESRDILANYRAVCAHHKYLTSIEETVRNRYTAGKILDIVCFFVYILAIPMDL